MKRLARLLIVLDLALVPAVAGAAGVVHYGSVCQADGGWMTCPMTSAHQCQQRDWTVKVGFDNGTSTAVQNCYFVVGATASLPDYHLPMFGVQSESQCEDRFGDDKRTSLLAIYVMNGGPRSLSCPSNALPPGFDINIHQDQGDCRP